MATTLVASKLPRMIVYLEPELKVAAEKLAKRQRRSVSSLVCLLLEQAVQKEGELPAEEPAIEKHIKSHDTGEVR